MNELDMITIHKAAKGDKKAFKAVYDHYSPFIWRVLYRMMSGDQAMAQELLQETFVKIHQVMKSFRSESSFSTWAYRITYNIALNALTREKKRASWESYEDTIESSNKTDRFENREIINKIMKNLTPDERFLLVAKEVDGMSFDELAEITNQNSGALRTKMHRLKEQVHLQAEKLLNGGYAHA